MKLLSCLSKALAWCVARVRINRVTHETIDGQEFLRKQRNPFCWILIVIGNCVFWFRKVPVRVLHQRQWLEWEQALHKAMGVEVPSQITGGLLLPKISGKPPWNVAGSDGGRFSGDEVVERLGLALEALYQLHQIEIVVDGQPVLFSHGDASVTNVIIGEDNKSATWLDFDLRHDLRQPVSARHADDLRAFTWTAVTTLAVEEHSEELMERFLQTMKAAYPNEETWLIMEQSSRGFWSAIDVFSYAQKFRRKLAGSG